jgi:soluble P-type ATPase
MKHAHHIMRSSSVEAFHERIQTGKHQLDQDKVAEYLLRGPARATRRQIATTLGMDTSTVSGIVNRLIKARVLHELPESEKAPCPITGNNVNWVTHTARIRPQADMFGGVQ